MILSKIIIIYLATCLISALTWIYVIFCCFEAITKDMMYTSEDVVEIREGLNTTSPISKIFICVFCPIINIIFVILLLKWKNKLVEEISNIFTQR
jgi:hypothetical protein